MIKSLLFMLLFPLTCIVANEPTDNWRLSNAYKASSIIRVVAEQVDSIEHFDNGRLYLKAENIVQTHSGYMLYNGRSTVHLPRLSSDQSGYYLFCQSRDDIKFKCPKCNYVWWFTKAWDIYCPVCGEMGDEQ